MINRLRRTLVALCFLPTTEAMWPHGIQRSMAQHGTAHPLGCCPWGPEGCTAMGHPSRGMQGDVHLAGCRGMLSPTGYIATVGLSCCGAAGCGVANLEPGAVTVPIKASNGDTDEQATDSAINSMCILTSQQAGCYTSWCQGSSQNN